jgi:hypothetical protein
MRLRTLLPRIFAAAEVPATRLARMDRLALATCVASGGSGAAYVLRLWFCL